jgi:N1221-like protein
MQLRRFVTEFPRIEPIAYAFTYADTASYEEEIEDWFSYTDAEFTRLRNAQETFERRWKKFETTSWVLADKGKQEAFIKREIIGLQATDLRRRCKSLQTLLHISLGVWDETAGVDNSVTDSSAEPGTDAEGKVRSKTVATKTQVDCVRMGVLLITECGGVPQIYELMKRAFDRLWYIESLGKSTMLNICRNEDIREPQIPETEIALFQDELFNVTTVLYILIESTRNDREGFSATYKELGMGLRQNSQI